MAVNHSTVVVVHGRAIRLLDGKIHVLRLSVEGLVDLAEAAALDWRSFTKVGGVADEIAAFTVNPGKRNKIRIIQGAVAMMEEGAPFTTPIELDRLQVIHRISPGGRLDYTNEPEAKLE